MKYTCNKLTLVTRHPPAYKAQVDRDAFMDTFGPYFALQLKQAVEFLTKEVNM